MNHSQRSREKDVAEYIGQFPSEELLKLAKTEDQQNYWGHLAAWYLAASRCWIAKLERKDPWLEAVEGSVIIKHYLVSIFTAHLERWLDWLETVQNREIDKHYYASILTANLELWLEAVEDSKIDKHYLTSILTANLTPLLKAVEDSEIDKNYLAVIFTGSFEPLLEAVENRTINKWYYDAIWAQANKLQSLWKLIEEGYELIFAAFTKAYPDPNHNYPFIGAPDLFCHIVETEANNNFAICLKPYHVVSNPNQIKVGKILRKVISTGAIKPQQRNFLKSLISQYRHNHWLLASLDVICDAIESGNREIFKKLEDHYAASVHQMDVTLTGLSRTRSSRNFEKFYSFTWHDGKIIRANKTGGTYSL